MLHFSHIYEYLVVVSMLGCNTIAEMVVKVLLDIGKNSTMERIVVTIVSFRHVNR